MAYVKLPSGRIVFLQSVEVNKARESREISMRDGSTAVMPGNPSQLIINDKYVIDHKTDVQAEAILEAMTEWLIDGGKEIWQFRLYNPAAPGHKEKD
jgi:hypothetical protein